MKKTKVRKKRGSFFSPLISITLVLFLTALFGMLVLYADLIKSYLKENVQVNIIFDDDAKEADIFWLQKKLDARDNIIKTNYIDKEQARSIMEDELGEDVNKVLGFNPFPASLEIFFQADYAQVDSITHFESDMGQYAFVKEVTYQKVILKELDKKLRIIGLVLLVFMMMFLLIAIVLINNTIRLTMYSQRFLIKTQQLVGATQGFIRKPYIVRAVLFGLAGGILANVIMVVLLLVVDMKFSVAAISDLKTNLLIAVVVLIFGMIITSLSSYYSVNKYLRLKLDDLY